MSNSKSDYPLIRFIFWALVLLTVYCAYYFALRNPPAWLYALLSENMVVSMAVCGQFGDMFGALNAFVSAFVLVFVIVTFLLERKKFEQTKDEYRYQIQPIIDFTLRDVKICFPSLPPGNQMLLIPRFTFSYDIKNITGLVPVNVCGEVYLSRLLKRVSVGKVVGGSGLLYPNGGESAQNGKSLDLNPLSVSDILSDLESGGNTLTFHFDFIYKNVLGGCFRIQRSLIAFVNASHERSRIGGIAKLPRHPSEGTVIKQWEKSGFSADFVTFAGSQLSVTPGVSISVCMNSAIDSKYFAAEPITTGEYEQLRQQFEKR